jgi:GDPmannose 4,6-dehydratase
MKKALITGVTGQDGSYLAEFLLKKGYDVSGVIRRSSSYNKPRLIHIFNDPFVMDEKNFRFFYGDLADSASIIKIINEVQPDEIYNLGAQSHVRISFDVPEYTANIAGLGTLRLLEAIRELKMTDKVKLYQSSSSEMFGNSPSPQSEKTILDPRSPYAAAKVFAHNITANYREAYNMFACSGILFNHESPRRGENFVTRKITMSIANILAKNQKKLILGNLDAKRDWGHAREYVEAMWLMMQQDKPDDFVIASGKTYSVRDFLEEAFNYVNLDWKKYVETDHPWFMRPTEVDALHGDATKAKEILKWEPKISFKELVHEMVDADIEFLKTGKYCAKY